MNREIKFRVWDKTNNRLSAPFGFGDLSGYEGEGGSWVSYYDIAFRNNDKDLTDNLVFQQFTGLKDKNGKEIYEGDIVEGKETGPKCTKKIKEIGIISREPSYFALGGYKLFIFDDLEIIGNIFENPELLK